MTLFLAHRIKQLCADRRGVSAVEFALIMPAFFGFLMGSMDLARGIWARSILEGELQRAARGGTMQQGTSAPRQNQLDKNVEDQIKQIASDATVTFKRTAYDQYKRLAARKEDFIDSNADGLCNAGETFQDVNGNASWDLDSGTPGQGSGEQVVLYTITVKYPRVLPVGPLLGMSQDAEITASTLMRNQPYSDLGEPQTGTCS